MKQLFAFVVLAVLVLVSAVGVFAQTTEPAQPTELPVVLMTVLGFFAPLLYQAVLKNIKNELVKFLVVLVLSGITGVLAIFFSGLPWAGTWQVIERVFVYSAIAYKLVWKPLVFEKVASLRSLPTTYNK